MQLRPCSVCRLAFKPKASRQLQCSPTCQKLARYRHPKHQYAFERGVQRPRKNDACPVCGSAITSQHSNSRYCGVKCRRASSALRRKQAIKRASTTTCKPCRWCTKFIHRDKEFCDTTCLASFEADENNKRRCRYMDRFGEEAALWDI